MLHREAKAYAVFDKDISICSYSRSEKNENVLEDIKIKFFEIVLDFNGIHGKMIEMNINFCENNEITNFREICMGKIAGGLLYRGSYPVFRLDKERDRIYEKLVFDAKINCIINLADNKIGLKRVAELVPWYCTFLENNRVIGLDIQFEFDFENKKENKIFNNKLKQGFTFLAEHEGPYLIHCNAGIDRAGFVAAILEALCGAGIDEILYDYLLSYGKKFADDSTGELNIHTGKIILGQLNTVTDGKIADTAHLQSNIEKYFLEGIGLTLGELELLKEKLTK